MKGEGEGREKESSNLCKSLKRSYQLGVFDLDIRQLPNSVLAVHHNLTVSSGPLMLVVLLCGPRKGREKGVGREGE